MKTVIIYIPGLGDRNVTSRQRILRLWRIYGVTTVVCPVNWTVSEPLAVKRDRILKVVDNYLEQGYIVSLVGESAGASMAMQIFAERLNKVHRVALVCGKFQYPEEVHAVHDAINPQLRDSVIASAETIRQLDGQALERILALRALYDSILVKRETVLKGAKQGIIPMVTHVGAIAYALTFGSWRIIRFLRAGAGQ